MSFKCIQHNLETENKALVSRAYTSTSKKHKISGRTPCFSIKLKILAQANLPWNLIQTFATWMEQVLMKLDYRNVPENKHNHWTTWMNFTRSHPHNIVLYIFHKEPSSLALTNIKTPEGAMNILSSKPATSTSTFMTVQWESIAHFCRFRFWHY